jgi:tetratricopeptide (TPR) repeat protein
MLSAEGFASFDRAIALDPANVELRVQAARVARLIGDRGRARTYLEGALAVLPEFGTALAERAILARDEGYPAEAVAWLEKSVAGIHGSPESLVASVANLASAYYAARRFAEALPVAQRAVALDSAPDLRFNLGRILEALGRPAEAESEYRRALAADPGYVPTRQGLERVTHPTPSPRPNPPAHPPAS